MPTTQQRDLDELREAITHMAATAGRMLRYDAWGRENAMWASMHERINEKLDQLGL